MATPTPQVLRIVATSDQLAVAREFMRTWLAPHAFDPTTVHSVVLAVDEVLANIVEHGYDGRPAGDIYLEMTIHDRTLEIAIRDTGRPYNPLQVPLPDLQTHVTEGHTGGLGLLFLRALMDDIAYETHATAGNRLLLRKTF